MQTDDPMEQPQTQQAPRRRVSWVPIFGGTLSLTAAFYSDSLVFSIICAGIAVLMFFNAFRPQRKLTRSYPVQGALFEAKAPKAGVAAEPAEATESAHADKTIEATKSTDPT
jgi:hypothetical protein